VRRAVRAATDACNAGVSVVAGDTRTLLEAELRGSAATVVENPDWPRGMGTSIRCGLRHLISTAPDLEAVVLLACDQPFANGEVVAALIAMYASSGKAIAASSYANTLGIPALFDRSCFEALLALPDDSGAKGLIESRRDDVAQIEFEQGAIDIDTPADFARLLGGSSAPSLDVRNTGEAGQ
jgi:molybdenum cofactor cytidylyltransferase